MPVAAARYQPSRLSAVGPDAAVSRGQRTAPNPVHNVGSPAHPGSRAGLDTGVVSIGSGNGHVTARCLPPSASVRKPARIIALFDPMGAWRQVITTSRARVARAIDNHPHDAREAVRLLLEVQDLMTATDISQFRRTKSS